jgi:hypothetical protein
MLYQPPHPGELLREEVIAVLGDRYRNRKAARPVATKGTNAAIRRPKSHRMGKLLQPRHAQTLRLGVSRHSDMFSHTREASLP